MSEEEIKSLEKIETLFSDTMKEVSNMSKDMLLIKGTQEVMARSHQVLADAAQSMASTFAKSEERQSKLEQTNQTLYTNKGITPNIFFLVTGTLCAVIVMGAAWMSDTSFKASLTSFEAGKRQAETLQAVKEKIEEVKDGHQ